MFAGSEKEKDTQKRHFSWTLGNATKSPARNVFIVFRVTVNINMQDRGPGHARGTCLAAL